MTFVEFFHTLTNGKKVFVSAEVGEDVDIKHVLTSNEPDADSLNYSDFPWKDRMGIYFAAQECQRARAREIKEANA